MQRGPPAAPSLRSLREKQGRRDMARSRKAVWGWMFFDWANQPFHTLILTFTFAPYFASAVA